MYQTANHVLRFEHFTLDLTRGCLRSGNEDVALRPKVFQLLRYFAENAGRLVSKEELCGVLWPNTFVSDDALVQCIRELRDRLSDADHHLIKTVPRRGYMLDTTVVPVTAPQVADAVAAEPSSGEGLREPEPSVSQPADRPGRTPIRGLIAGGFVCAVLLAAFYLFGRAPAPFARPGSASLVEAAPAQSPLRAFKDCDLCPEMVELPQVGFLMGSPETEAGREGLEGPQRRVPALRRFAIGKFEVTIAQFAAFAAESGFKTGNSCRVFVQGAQPSEWPVAKASFEEPGFRVTGLHPAVCVNWGEAKAYVDWLSQKTGRPYRLPSEAEWEFAARAGTTTAYSFGNDIGKLCQFARFADADSRFPWRSGCHSAIFEPGALRIGLLAPNPWGLFDMHGNVWEWTEDCWTTDARLLPSDGSAYRPPGTCDARSVRGGGWGAERRKVRSAQRMKIAAEDRFYHLGFRVALPLGQN